MRTNDAGKPLKPRLNEEKIEQQSVFVLHTYPFKETSLVVELFSQQFGRIAAVAKGARRPRSSLRGMLQSFQCLQATWGGKAELKNLYALDWADTLLDLQGEALMCGFYLNELLIRLLPREDPHERLFEYYQATLKSLAQAPNLAASLRQFELKLLQELGYALPLTYDENGEMISAQQSYRYEAEYGACALTATKNGVELRGKTLLDMAKNDYSDAQTQAQSKQLMRYLLAHYLGEKPLHTRQLLIDLQGL